MDPEGRTVLWLRKYRFSVAAACIVAISVVGLISSAANYFTFERQREVIESLVLVRDPFISSMSRLLLDQSSRASAMSEMKNYQLNTDQLTRTLLLDASTALRRQAVILIAWLLVLLVGSASLLFVYRVENARAPSLARS